MRTPVCDKFGIEFPIFAFSHCRDVVAAVSRAGGFGVLGALAFTPEELEIELAWIDEHVDGKPYGVDLVMPANYVGKGGVQPSADELRAMIPQEHRDYVDKVLAEYGVRRCRRRRRAARAAGLGVDDRGDPRRSRSRSSTRRQAARQRARPAAQGGRRQGARARHPGRRARRAASGTREKQVEIGVDIIVAQGTEAGGHTGEISTMVLVPEVVDAVGADVPVLAAGGIGTRPADRGRARAGRAGRVDRFDLAHRRRGRHARRWSSRTCSRPTSRDTVRSRAMTGKPARQLRTAWTDAWERPDAPETLPMPLQGILYGETARRVTPRARPRARRLAGRADRRPDEPGPARRGGRARPRRGVDRHGERLCGLLAATRAPARAEPHVGVNQRGADRAHRRRARGSSRRQPQHDDGDDRPRGSAAPRRDVVRASSTATSASRRRPRARRP